MSTRGSFDEIDEARLRGGFGVKWGAVNADVIPAWVADMDFGVPENVVKALSRTVAAEDFGYPFWPEGDPVVRAFENRMRRHGWTPSADRTRVYTDLIQVLQVMIEHSTALGDGIAVQVPAYPPFLATIERSGRHIIPIPAHEIGSGWSFDMPNLADHLRVNGCTMLLLVNPHNPTGRVLTRTELRHIADVAEELDLTVLSDEIHAELVYAPHEHIPFASLSSDAAARTITTTSATKAFNIAGLRCAVAHVGPDSVWDRLEIEPLDYFGQPSILSRVATVTAWTESDEWLTGLHARLDENRAMVADWATSAAHAIKHLPPEATYLAWLDFSDTPAADNPAAWLHRPGGVYLSDGAEFSQHTDVPTGHLARLNFATSKPVLEEILLRIDRIVRNG